MAFLLALLIFSFIVNGLSFIPFINILYKLKFQRQKQKTKDAFEKPTPIFDKFNAKKAGTPVGGGLLIIINSLLLLIISSILLYYFWIPVTSVYPNIGSEIKILIFTFVSFGALGLYDDFKKMFLNGRGEFFGLRLRHKLILEIVLAVIISTWLYNELGIKILHVPFLGVVNMGLFMIPFSTFVIVAFANAYNITDGLDGLAAGVLMIALFAFWVISRSILDTPISLFITVWLGGIIAFLYFNVPPARIFLGDVGALSFGATFAVIGLILGKVFSLLIIGGIFVAEVTSSLIQLTGKYLLKRKFFKVAPFHLWLEFHNWEESKVVMRAWLAGAMLAVLGLWLAFIK